MSRGRLYLRVGSAGVAVLAIAIIAFQLNRPSLDLSQIEIASAEATPRATAKEEAGHASPTLTTGSALTERPLFEPGRRPFKPPPPPAPPPPLAAPAPPAPPPAKTPAQQGFQLSGTMLIQGKHVAMLRQPGGTRTIWVNEGAEVGGWTAVRIEQGRITFRLGVREEELELPRGGGRGTAARATSGR